LQKNKKRDNYVISPRSVL